MGDNHNDNFRIIANTSFKQISKNKEKETQIEKSENIVKSSNSEDDQEKDYQKESITLTSTSEISEKYQEKFGKIIDEFYTACIENDIEKAYGLLIR